MQTTEQSIVERIKLSRSNSEPEQSAPTEATEAVNVSKDAPVEEVITEEAQVDEDVTTETEESAETEIAQATDENEGEELYVEYKGREINLKDVFETEQGQLRQADYTRKTKSHAEDVKAFNVEVDAFKDKQSKFDGHIATLEAMISEESLSAEELVELREYEPERYIEYTEKMDKRRNFVEQNKPAKQTVDFDVESERRKLWESNPSWLQDGKQTKEFQADMSLIQDYASKNGYSNDDFSNFRANDFQTMLNASKYLALNGKNAAIEKKVRKAPVMTKPRATAKGGQTDLDLATKAFKSNPSDKNAVALRKIKRQLNSKG